MRTRFYTLVAMSAALAMLAWSATAYGQSDDDPGETDKTVPQPSAGQKLALQTKPSVVRVIAGYLVGITVQGKREQQFFGGHGSGFFVDPDGYIATNAHVVEFVHIAADKAREQIIKQVLTAVAQRYKIDLQTLPRRQLRGLIQELEAGIRIEKKVTDVVLPNGDKLSYDIKAYGAPVSTDAAKDVAILKVQTRNAPTLLIGDEATVQIQDKILAVGYPGAADDLIGVLDAESALEATITDGTVSAKKKTADGAPVIQVTTIISPGNSGGPAINDKGEVVGLATFGHAKRQGYNFIVAASTLEEFVRQAGADNSKESTTNRVYHEALELHWQQRYTEAIGKFEEVKQLFAHHSEAPKLIAEARELKLAGKEKAGDDSDDGDDSGAVIAIVIAVGFAAIAGVFLVMRSRGSAGPARRRDPWQHPGHPGQHPGHPGPGHPGQHPGHPGPGHPGMHPGQQANGAAGPGHRAPASPAGAGGQPGQPGFAQTIAINAGGNARTIAVGTSGQQLASLQVIRGPLQGQQFALGPHGITVGREPSVAQIVIADGRVSSKHVWIGFQDGQLLAIDRGSTNGTFVNDMARGRITQTRLQHGDTVIVSEPDVCALTVVNPPRHS